MASSAPAPVAFSRFQLPGLNLPLNWTPHAASEKIDFGSENVTMEPKHIPAQGEGSELFKTALNEADDPDDSDFSWVLQE